MKGPTAVEDDEEEEAEAEQELLKGARDTKLRRNPTETKLEA